MNYSYLEYLIIRSPIGTSFKIELNMRIVSQYQLEYDSSLRQLILYVKDGCTFNDLVGIFEIIVITPTDDRVLDHLKSGLTSRLYKPTLLNDVAIIPRYDLFDSTLNIVILEDFDKVGCYTGENSIYVYMTPFLTSDEILDLLNKVGNVLYVLVDTIEPTNLLYTFNNINLKSIGGNYFSKLQAYTQESQDIYVSRSPYIMDYVERLEKAYPSINVVIEEKDWDNNKTEHIRMEWNDLESGSESAFRGNPIRNAKGHIKQYQNCTAKMVYFCNSDRTTFEMRLLDYQQSNFIRNLTGRTLKHPYLGDLGYSATASGVNTTELDVTYSINDTEVRGYYFEFEVNFTYNVYRMKREPYPIDRILLTLTVANREKIKSVIIRPPEPRGLK